MDNMIRELEQQKLERKMQKKQSNNKDFYENKIRELEGARSHRAPNNHNMSSGNLDYQLGRSTGPAMMGYSPKPEVGTGLGGFGTANLTNHYVNKHKKTDYFDNRLRQMEKKHEQDIEDTREKKKQDYMNERLH